MSITWLVPAALAGLVLVALPIAVHLLARQQTRQVAFPSLRFLLPSYLSALRRRSIQDAVLLACRVLIVAAAAAALAAPVIVTPARQAAHAQRIARAIVVEPGADAATVTRQAAGAFRSATFSRDRMGDAIADAVAWLGDQPPAAREIVIVAAFALGQLSDADLLAVPGTTGIRLVRVGSAPPARDVEWPVIVRHGGAVQHEARQLRLEDDRTTVIGGAVTPLAEPPVAILAAPADQALADAALRAVLAAGLAWPAGAPSRVVLAWQGAEEAAIALAASVATVIRMDRPSPPARAASAVARALAGATAVAHRVMEPVRLDSDQLARWQRRPGTPPSTVDPVDEGDRRWFWGAALVLLAVEWILRARQRETKREAIAHPPEAQVA